MYLHTSTYVYIFLYTASNRFLRENNLSIHVRIEYLFLRGNLPGNCPWNTHPKILPVLGTLPWENFPMAHSHR